MIRIDRVAMGDKITGIIEDAGMTKTEFAKRMGVRLCNVTLWTYGDNIPSLTNLIRMSKFAGQTLDEFLEGIVYDDGSESKSRY